MPQPTESQGGPLFHSSIAVLIAATKVKAAWMIARKRHGKIDATEKQRFIDQMPQATTQTFPDLVWRRSVKNQRHRE
jgi:hypothetical protein